MKMTFANGDTKTMAFEDVVPNAPIDARRLHARRDERRPAAAAITARRRRRSDCTAMRIDRTAAQVVLARGSAPASIMRWVRRSARSRNSAFAQVDLAQPLPQASCGRSGSAPTAARSRSTARRSAAARAPAPRAGDACRSATSAARAASAASPRSTRAGQRRQDGEAGLEQLVPLDERPEPLEVGLGPRRVDDEVAGDAVAGRPRDLDAARGLVDRRVLRQPVEAFVGRRLEAEEDVEVLARCGRQASSSSGWRATRSTRLWTSIHCLRMPRRRSSLRQLQAARRVVPEQIVGHEDVIADRREVAADRVDRSLAHGARVQLPDRAERAAERTAARGLDQPRRAMRQARVLPAPRRRRDAAPAAARRPASSVPVSPAVRTMPPSPSRSASPGTVVERLAALERVADARQRALAVVEHDGGHVRVRETARDTRPRCGRRRRSARPASSARTRAASASTSSVSSACIAAMPTRPGRDRAHLRRRASG